MRQCKKTLTHLFTVFLFKPSTFFTSKSAKVVQWLLWWMLSDLSRSEYIVSSSITGYKFPGFQFKYDFFQCYLFASCIMYTRTVIGFGLVEFTVLITDSIKTLIVLVKFVACNIATAQETKQTSWYNLKGAWNKCKGYIFFDPFKIWEKW